MRKDFVAIFAAVIGGMGLLAVAFALATRIERAPAAPARYEFLVGAQSIGLWRCNRETGQVDFCNAVDRHWMPVTETNADPLGLLGHSR
jgi:hypothetical protein